MTSVAVIGLGIMGGAIARHLAAEGIDVSGYDLSSEACERARMHGIRIVDAVSALSPTASVVILSLPSFAAAQTVVDDLASFPQPLTLIETSTLGLDEKNRLRDTLHGTQHQLLDCPISGTGGQMENKDVVIYASGDDSVLTRVEKILELFSKQVLQLGAFGNGTKMKLIANHLVAIHNVAAAEAVLLGMQAGFTIDTLLAAIAPGAGNSKMFELRGPMVAQRSYLPAAMKLSLWSKDMDLIRSFASDLSAVTPLLDTVSTLYDTALASGLGDQDTASVAEVLRSASAAQWLEKEKEKEKERGKGE